jgi:hypothetical protein
MLQDGDEANAQQAGAVGGAEDVVGIRRGKNQWIAIAATYATGRRRRVAVFTFG